MKCAGCGGSLQGPEGLALECAACARFLHDCTCASSLGFTLARRVHCLTCDEWNIDTISTTTDGWRSIEVDPSEGEPRA